MDTDGTFEAWCIVELFGHARIAGRVTEEVIAGQGFVRVDVPALPAHNGLGDQPGFTRIYGASAIYSITPVDEITATRAADSMRVRPVEIYMPALPNKINWEDSDPDDNLDPDKD